MAVNFDPEYLKAIGPMLPAISKMQKPAVHDVINRRVMNDGMFRMLFSTASVPPDVEVKIYHAKAKDGFVVPVYHYRKRDATTKGSGSVPAIFHTHGGGFISLSAAMYNNVCAAMASATRVQIFSVDYRLAPEHPHPTPIEDCYAGLRWVYDHAPEFNIDLNRVAVYGDNAGGGLTACLAILARDRKLSPPLAKQFLIYPMLDDRNQTPTPMEEALVWNTEDNITGWTAYVGKNAGKEGISPYAAAARVESVKGLPPTYMDLGTLDLFRDEDLQYASRLAAANIEVELHMYPGVPHAFDALAPKTKLVGQVNANRIKALTSF